MSLKSGKPGANHVVLVLSAHFSKIVLKFRKNVLQKYDELKRTQSASVTTNFESDSIIRVTLIIIKQK